MEESNEQQDREQPDPVFSPFTDTTHQLEGATSPNSKYRDGKTLSNELLAKFSSEAKACIPLDEIDSFYWNRQTFVVIGKWGTIYRFSRSSDNYLMLNPQSPVRKLAIYLHTNWLFSAFIVATILFNIYPLMTTQSSYIVRAIASKNEGNWVLDTIRVVDYICLGVYCVELLIKLLARGMFPGEFTAIRSPWVWLDIMVILTGFTHTWSFLWLNRGSVSWIRIFKLIPLIPSVRQAFRLSLKAFKRLCGMFVLLCLLLWLFSLIATQCYMGSLTQKCIRNFPEHMVFSHEAWIEHNKNSTNWYYTDSSPLCGNVSGSLACPVSYTCLQGYGPNPDNGYTNFDDVFWSLLSVLRIATEDYTEEILKQLIAANGPYHMIFFTATFFLITFPMGCLFFSILGKLFIEEWDKTNGEELNDSGRSGNEATHTSASGLSGYRRTLHKIFYNEWTPIALICVICLDVIGIASYFYGIEQYTGHHFVFTQFIPCVVFVVYVLEFFAKFSIDGPQKYFTNPWNALDVLILIQFVLQLASHFGFLFAALRLLKLLKYWPSLQLIFVIYWKTVSHLRGWLPLGCIVLGFIVLIGPFQLGESEWSRIRQVTDSEDKLTPDDIPRYTFIHFWHSFRIVVRMQTAEWIETLWDVLPYSYTTAFSYFFLANLCGALFLSYILVTVVFLTVKELQTNDALRQRGLRRFISLALSRIPGFNKSREVHFQNGFETLPAFPNLIDEIDEALLGERKDYGSREALNTVQAFTEHWVYKTLCFGVILLGSISMTALQSVTMDWEEGFYVIMISIEILFTVIFAIIVVYELVAFGLKDSVTKGSWLFDMLIVLENIINLSAHFASLAGISGGPFRVGVFYLRCFRPLMLVSRVRKLKAPFRMIKFEIKQVWEIILAIFFIWLLFDTFAVHWLNGLYHKCIDHVGSEQRLDKTTCLSSNFTWENSQLHFDDSAHGFMNMAFMVSRMGWVQIINDASDATDYDMARVKDNSKMWLIYFILFLLSGGLGALGIFFSYVLNVYQQDKGNTIILTEAQTAIYNERKKQKEPQLAWIALEEDYIPVPSNSIKRSIYNFVTNWKFDAAIMIIIILDNIFLSLESYQQSVAWSETLAYLSLIFLIYILEAIMKLIAWDKHYFKSGWNIYDFIVAVTALGEVIFEHTVAMYIISPGLLRVFRLLRIFRFLLAQSSRSKSVKAFISAASNVRHAFGNLILFQLTVMWAFAVLGMNLFGHVGHGAGLDWFLNFSTLGNSLMVVTLLLGFPALDTLLSGLSIKEGCDIADEKGGLGTCGNKTAAAVYLTLYACITFSVMLNMYAVFISEILSEFNRLKAKEKSTKGDGVALQDVITRKADDEEVDI